MVSVSKDVIIKSETDIESEFKDEIKSLNRLRYIRRCIGWGTMFIMSIILIIVWLFQNLNFGDVFGILIIIGILSVVLLIIFEKKIKIKITDLLAYYLFLLSINLKKLDFDKPQSAEKTSEIMKQFFNHISNYLSDYALQRETYYADFDFRNIVKVKLCEIQSILKKLNTFLTNKKIPEKEISEKLIEMSKEIYKKSEFSEKFVESLDYISKKLEKERETEMYISIKHIFSLFKVIPYWMRCLIAYLFISALIYWFVPMVTPTITMDKIWEFIIIVGVGFLIFFKK